MSTTTRLSQWLKRPPPLAAQATLTEHAEQALLAETLLRSCARLLGKPDPDDVARHMCDAIVESAPHIVLAWVWFGDPHADVIVPHIAVGSASEYSRNLRIERGFFTQMGPAFRALSGLRTRAFEVSPVSLYTPWRSIASEFGVRSVLLVPVADSGDERGLLALYSTRPRYFESMGVGLFETVGQLFHAVLAQSRRQAQWLADASTDAVTGLPNRRHATRTLENAWSTTMSPGSRGVLMRADFDRNYEGSEHHYHHPLDDNALQLVAAFLRRNLRPSDLIARWEGDGFLLWIPAIHTTGARALTQKLIEEIKQSPFPATDGQHSTMQLRIAIGATEVVGHEAFAAVLDRANTLLYRAEDAGGNCAVFGSVEV